MKVVIANSVGIDTNGYYIIHSPSRWSEGVENKFNWFAYYPWELAYTSSILKRETEHKVKFIDGCLEKLDSKTYFRRLADEKPDWLIIESASRTFKENVQLAKDIKRQFNTRLIFVGQHASAFPEETLAEGVDYVCIGEYEFTVLEIIKGVSPRNILGLYPNPRRPLLDVTKLPFPEDEDVSRLSYGLPGEPSSEYLEIQAYASRGCPFSCSFCVARNLYYRSPNFRPRPVHNIIEEIKLLKNKYPQMEGIFFDEECHNGNKDFILNLCLALKENKLNTLHYEAMCDIRLLDKELMKAMYEAGYYKIRFGIETASPKISSSINKFINSPSLISTLEEIKQTGLKTYGTFMFGAPGSNKDEDNKTVDLIRRLVKSELLDNVQISICTPQPGTPFYEWVKEKGYLVTNDFSRFDGGRSTVVSYPDYNSDEIRGMKDKGVLTRDHKFLSKNLRSGYWEKWIKNIYLKYGFWGSAAKLMRRLKIELSYQMGKIKCRKSQ